MSDRTYFRFAWAWHELVSSDGLRMTGSCKNVGYGDRVETADRIPPAGHLCGTCARSIAARTDVEEPDNDAVLADAPAYADDEYNGRIPWR